MAADSAAETYVACKLSIDNWRWAGVPFYLRTGKYMKSRSHRDRNPLPPGALYAISRHGCRANASQLDDPAHPARRGHRARVRRQAPRADRQLEQRQHGFRLQDLFQGGAQYRLRDADLRLHDRRRRRFFSAPTPSKPDGRPCSPSSTPGRTIRPADFPNYAAGSDGPAAADELLARDGRAWRPLDSRRPRSDGGQAQDRTGPGGCGWHTRHRGQDLDRAGAASCQALHDAGIRFAITSGRPPLGMAMLFDALDIDTPIAGFNGGLFVKRDLTILEEKTVPDDVARQAIDLMRAHGLDTWVYSGNDWLITKIDAPHVAREAWTVKFEPKVVSDVREHLQQRRQDRRHKRRSRQGTTLRARRASRVRPARDRHPVATLLSRRHQQRRQQGRRGGISRRNISACPRTRSPPSAINRTTC